MGIESGAAEYSSTERSTAGLFPVCIQRVSLRDAGPPPGHTFLKHRLAWKDVSRTQKCCAVCRCRAKDGVGGELGGERGGGQRSAGDNSFAAPMHSHTTMAMSKTRQLVN